MSRRAVTASLVAASVAYLASWFLPVVAFTPGTLVEGINAGWKAFFMALSMALKPDRLDGFWGLCTAGVLANVVVIAVPWVLRRRPAPAWLPMALAASFVINLAWIPMTSARLLPGYWLWIGSIGMLAATVALIRRTQHASGHVNIKLNSPRDEMA